ncbi:MAG: hypothetical protein AB2421_12660 [Thermotaleaceae bacterium]
MQTLEGLSLFTTDYLSSVTSMVLAVNLITQVVKEIFLKEDAPSKVAKVTTLVASTLTVSLHHYSLWVRIPSIFHHSLLEFFFLIFLNSILITALSMGNYEVLNITKEKKMKKMENYIQSKGLYTEWERRKSGGRRRQDIE